MKVFTITETSSLTARLTKQDKKEWNGLVSMNQNCIDVDGNWKYLIEISWQNFPDFNVVHVHVSKNTMKEN